MRTALALCLWLLSACTLLDQMPAANAHPPLPPMPTGYRAVWHGDFVLLSGSGVGSLADEKEAVKRILEALPDQSVCILRLDSDERIDLVPNKTLLLSIGIACLAPPPDSPAAPQSKR